MNMFINVLIACEESQRVCIEFRKRGFNAFSCDIQECSGGHPEWHIMDDVLPLLDGDCCFKTMDGESHVIYGRWDLIIAHPPCTYLTTAATRCQSMKRRTVEEINDRTMSRIAAIKFFMKFITANCNHIAVENPQGVVSSFYRQPDQYIHPYYFAKSVDDENYVTKRTGLWLDGLPLLERVSELPCPLDDAECWGNGKKSIGANVNMTVKNVRKRFPVLPQLWLNNGENI